MNQEVNQNESRYAVTDRNRIRRRAVRARYDQSSVHAILDATFLCHVGFAVDGQSYVIPTVFGRRGEEILLHGSPASRLLKIAGAGEPVCIAVTLLDGLVLARSAMHHSANYRSAVVFGRGRALLDRREKAAALECVVEHVLSGRSAETRAPTDRELDATGVVSVTIEEASAKVRTGPPVDDEADYSLPYWAGVLPTVQGWAAPVPDDRLASGVALPSSVVRARPT